MRLVALALGILALAAPPAEASDKNPMPAPSTQTCPVSIGAFWIAATGSKQHFVQYRAMLHVSTPGQYALRIAVIGDAESMRHTISADVDSSMATESEMTFAWPSAAVAAIRLDRLTRDSGTELRCESSPVVSVLNSPDESR